VRQNGGNQRIAACLFARSGSAAGVMAGDETGALRAMMRVQAATMLRAGVRVETRRQDKRERRSRCHAREEAGALLQRRRRTMRQNGARRGGAVWQRGEAREASALICAARRLYAR